MRPTAPATWPRGLVTFAALLVTPHAFAYDISDALLMAEEFFGQEMIVGLEDYVEEHPDEALSILLRKHDDPEAPTPFGTTGKVRTSYEALKDVINDAGKTYGVPPALIDAVIRTESGYRVDAVSRVGAQGLMQLMPETARSLGVENPLDPRQNVLGGTKYLRQMMDRFGKLHLAVAAYNAGPSAVAKHQGIPPFPETQRYVRTVLRRVERSR